ncbi:hypothetical protein MPSEU_000034200 [Mayamaea pseudoterrestris]|nr:hypothetical protein MPSEU_000034200 [Mayamaea pseudoterrestris]
MQRVASVSIQRLLLKRVYKLSTNRLSFCRQLEDGTRRAQASANPSSSYIRRQLTRQFSSVTGLFSIPNLIKPSDFLRAAYEAAEDCNRFRDALALRCLTPLSTRSQATQILYELDLISKTVCNVIDAAELCRSVHVDPVWRDAAQKAFDALAHYIAELNSDERLYHALKQVTGNQPLFQQLSEEEQRFAGLLQAEFERDGIQLPEAQRARVADLAHSVSQLEGLFSQNIVHSDQTFRVAAAPVKAILPNQVLSSYGIEEVATLDESDSNINQLELHTNQPHLLQSLIRYSHDPNLRRDVYMAHSTSVPENLAVLDALIDRRRQLATALGFESYAHRVLQDRMAKHPNRVVAFLKELQINNYSAWKRDMEMIARAKQAVEFSSQVEPWDISFYISLLKARNGFDINTVTPYLTIDNCVRAIQVLVSRLFGMTMQEQVMDAAEAWDGEHAQSNRGIRKFTFVNEKTGESHGTVYLDLHARPGKYTHAAHFTVRCGCLATDPSHEPPEYQQPVVVLVCNLSSAKEEFLSHSEVETLFHEFGHALHSLLSRTNFQHMSGTRAAMDFVETPSHVMEYFVWDKQFLKILAVQTYNGEPLPDDAISKLQQSRYEFASLERQNQILYSNFDQILFGAATEATRNMSTTQIFSKLHADLGVPHAEGTHWHSRFGHLVTYGAGYYGYLYSQVFAGDIWKQCFQADSLAKGPGQAFWRKMLIHGGAKDPSAMLSDLLGRPPKADFFSQASQ